MTVLLDTNIFLSALYKPEVLDKTAQKIILASDAIYVSAISMLEITLLKKSGRIKLIDEMPHIYTISTKIADYTFIDSLSGEILERFTNLEFFQDHKDPFDRIIIATAQAKNLTILTSDKKFQNYPVKIKLLKPVEF